MGFFRNMGRADNCCEDCQNNPCDECDECVVGLQCEIKSASKTKPAPCGIQAYDGSQAWYLTETFTEEASGTSTSDFYGEGCICEVSVEIDKTRITAWSWNAETVVCSGPAVTCSGTEVYSHNRTGSGGGCTSSGSETYTLASDCSGSWSSTGAGASCPAAGQCSTSWSFGSVVVESATRKTQAGTLQGPDCDTVSGTYTKTWELSDQWTPETTNHLIERTRAAIPAFAGTYGGGGSCESSRNLSPDEQSFSASKMNYRFDYGSNVPGGKKVTINWNLVWRPEGGGSPTSTALSDEITAGNRYAGPFLADAASASADGSYTVENITCELVDA